MELADKFACADLIQAWAQYRDQAGWAELLATFHPDGEIAVSWFRGPFPEFVERSNSPSKHLISPPVTRLAGDRAIAETTVGILVRREIGGVLVDMTSNARFIDRLERRERAWKILERTAIFERDRLDPVVPSEAFVRMMQTVDVEKFPEPYRYMAFHLAAAGQPLALPSHYDGAPHTRELYARYEAWLDQPTERPFGRTA
jgi:hypothetical protein